jgi:hypothetical protein
VLFDHSSYNHEHLRSSRARSSHRPACRCRRASRSPRTRPPHTSIRTRRRLGNRHRRPHTHRNIRLSTPLLTLNAHDHVILRPELQARGFPGAEVVARVYGTATVHFCADRPVLLEVGVVADDRGCVGAFFLPDFVGCAVAVEGTEVVGARVVGGVVLAHCEVDPLELCFEEENSNVTYWIRSHSTQLKG